MQMFPWFTLLATGLVAGTFHVFAGPDHLAAVAPLAVFRRQGAWRLGLRWGLGHASGVLLVATFAWAVREALPIEAFSAFSERLVGVLLIAIGVWGLRKAMRWQIHAHPHHHIAGLDHVHVHSHSQPEHSEPAHALHTHAALGIGILHGLAGASHFLGVLPALAMPNRLDAALYLLSFGFGTIAAMVLFSSVIAALGARFSSAGALKGLMAGFSFAAIGVGAFWLVL